MTEHHRILCVVAVLLFSAGHIAPVLATPDTAPITADNPAVSGELSGGRGGGIPSDGGSLTSPPAESRSVRFDLPPCEIDVTQGGDLRITMEGSVYVLEERRPQLPKFTDVLTFPPETRIAGWRLEGLSHVRVPVDGEIAPVPPSVPRASVFDIPSPEPFTSKDADIYGSAELYPDSWAGVRKGMGLLKDKDEIGLYVFVDLFPVRYSPLGGYVEIATEATVTVEYGEDPAALYSRSGGKSLDMVVLGPETFREAAQPLVEHKDATGLRTSFVSLNEIYGSAFFPVEGNDNPEKIKYFIRNARKNWGAVYVLLLGDSDLFPVRYAWVPDGFDDDGGEGKDGARVPTDIYYADIYNGTGAFCDWNANGNGRYGEENDGIDFIHDVYVGRLPAGDDQELAEMVTDIIHYENNETGGEWFLRANLHGTDTFQGVGNAEGEYTLDQIVDEGYLAGFQIKKLYDTEGALNTQAVIDGINSGIGFAAFSNHGHHDGWGYTSASSEVGIFENPNVASLTNENQLPVFTFDACMTGSFDNEIPSSVVSGTGESLSEELLLKSGGGGIAVISATRVGWGDWGQNYVLHRSGYMDIHLYKSFQEGGRTPGRMLAGAMSYYMAEVGDNDAKDHKTLTEFNTFGDPSLAMGGLPISSRVVNGTSVVKPGASGVFKVQVENLGPFSENVDIDLSGLPPEFKGAAAQNTPVISGGSSVISVSITPPRGLIAGSTFEIPVGVLCRNRGEFHNVSLVIGEEYGVALTSPLKEDSTEPGAEVPFWINITNKGNLNDTFLLGFQEARPGWRIRTSVDNVTLEAFASTEFTLYIRPANESLHGKRTVTVVASSAGGSVRADITFKITIRQIYEFSTDNVPEHRALPGERFWLDIPVNNTGNGRDTFNLNVRSYPEGWLATFDEYHLNIEPYSTENASLEVVVPPRALAGDYIIEIGIASVGGEIDKVAGVDISVRKVYDLEAVIDVREVTLEHRETAEFIIGITNRGNYNDTLEMDVRPAWKSWETNKGFGVDVGSAASWDVSLSSEEVSLGASEEKEISVVFKPGEETLNGTYAFNITAVSELNESLVRVIKVEITIKARYGCNLSVSDSSLSLYPGEKGNVSLTVNNQGNTESDMLLYCSAPDVFDTAFHPHYFRIEGFNSSSGTMTIKAKKGAPAGDYRLNLSVSPRNAPAGENGSSHSILNIRIRQVFDLSLSPPRMDRNIDIGKDDYLSCTFRVTNEGNGIDSARVVFEGDLAELVYSPTRNLSLRMGESKGLTVNLSIPSDMSGGSYLLGINVTSAGDISVSANSSLRLTAEREPEKGIFAEGFGRSVLWILGAILAAIVLLAGGVRLFGVRRRRRYEKEETQVLPPEIESEPEGPSYEDLYSDLPNIPDKVGERDEATAMYGSGAEYGELHGGTDWEAEGTEGYGSGAEYRESYVGTEWNGREAEGPGSEAEYIRPDESTVWEGGGDEDTHKEEAGRSEGWGSVEGFFQKEVGSGPGEIRYSRKSPRSTDRAEGSGESGKVDWEEESPEEDRRKKIELLFADI